MDVKLLSYGTEEDFIYNPLIQKNKKYYIMTREPECKIIKDSNSFIASEALTLARFLHAKVVLGFPMLESPLTFLSLQKLIDHLRKKDKEGLDGEASKKNEEESKWITIPESEYAQHSRTKCMKCSAIPKFEVLWAEGIAHAWFCKTHLKEFIKEHLEDCKKEGFALDIDQVKEIDGEASKRMRENSNPDILKKILSSFDKFTDSAFDKSHYWKIKTNE